MQEVLKNQEEFESGGQYVRGYQIEKEIRENEGFGFEHVNSLFDHLSQFDLSMQLLINHNLGGESSKEICETLININDPNRLKTIFYELSNYNRLFCLNASPENNIIVMNIVNGAIYSPYVKMKYDIWDRYVDKYTDEEINGLDKSSKKYIEYFNYAISCKNFMNMIDQCAIEQKELTLEVLEQYNCLIEKEKLLLDM